ncbi:arrestin-like protein [Dinothrombium tinctorium]|uniref:Arrestin-like protein n=1 Tax=Dinothrombium tinctorium TaxID=1965070 RepID=A0A443RBR1_9ACAR|nr:arrestin-like protein [Dinothrombium tinctorium]
MGFVRQIHKKSTPDGKLTLYLAKREIIDHVSHVDPIEGVVVLDDEYLHKKICGQSVILNSYGEGKQCGVYYKVRVFIANDKEEPIKKRNSVEMSIRKFQWAPSGTGKQPCTIIRKDFMFSPGELELEATLDKPLYFHGENIAVNITVRNYSNKTVKRYIVTAMQNIDISMFTQGHYRTVVACVDSQEGCPIEPGSSFQKTVMLAPSTSESTDKRGVAVDGDETKENIRLASSTLVGSEEKVKDIFGIQISYAIRVKLMLGAMAGELVAEMPFLLMAPRGDQQIGEEKKIKI